MTSPDPALRVFEARSHANRGVGSDPSLLEGTDQRFRQTVITTPTVHANAIGMAQLFTTAREAEEHSIEWNEPSVSWQPVQRSGHAWRSPRRSFRGPRSSH
jgi:hypothetical protein